MRTYSIQNGRKEKIQAQIGRRVGTRERPEHRAAPQCPQSPVLRGLSTQPGLRGTRGTVRSLGRIMQIASACLRYTATSVQRKHQHKCFLPFPPYLCFFFSQIASDLKNNKYKPSPNSDCQEYLLEQIWDGNRY